MFWGNGLANIIAAAILAAAIVYTGGFGGKSRPPTDEEIAAWRARAVGDIKNDIVVNCGCCGEGRTKQSF